MMAATLPLDSLYRELVLEHHRHPRGAHAVPRVDLRAEGKNPSCGDEVALTLMLEGERIVDVGVHARGCAISTASGSMLAEQLRGRTLAEARQLATVFKAALHGEQVPSTIDLGDLESLLGVQHFPVRVPCALLPWVTLLQQVLAQAPGASVQAAPSNPSAAEVPA